MSKLLAVIALFSSVPAFAADHASVAFERLASDVQSRPAPVEKLQSAAAYLDTLARVGASPISTRGCVNSIFLGSSLELCAPKVMAKGGTGGVD